jgi:hypothetical protein
MMVPGTAALSIDQALSNREAITKRARLGAVI